MSQQATLNQSTTFAEELRLGIYNPKGDLIAFGTKEEIKDFYQSRRDFIDTKTYKLEQVSMGDWNTAIVQGNKILRLYEGVLYPDWIINSYQEPRKKILHSLRKQIEDLEALLEEYELTEEDSNTLKSTVELVNRIYNLERSKKLEIPLDKF